MTQLSRFWLLLVVLCIGTVSVQAHGGGTPRLTNVEAGPYRVFAWTSPEPMRSGEVHITIAVTLLDVAGNRTSEANVTEALSTAVTDATVRVTFAPVGQEGQPQSELDAATIDLMAGPSDLTPIYYETDAELQVAGQWETTLYVDGPLGQGQASFLSTVEPPLGINWTIVLFIVGALASLIFIRRIRVMRK